MESNTGLPSFIVLMAASRENKLMGKYLQQLREADIPHHVDYLPLTTPSVGLGECLRVFRDLARRFSSYDRLIITDAWDVLCYGGREEVARTLSILPPGVIFASERNCYPEGELASVIDARYVIDFPWRYVNGGMLTSSPSSLLSWCDEVERHPAYDAGMIGQQWLNRRLAEGSPLAMIDYQTRLFYCMFREHESPWLRNNNGKPWNQLTGTFPPFIHHNGSYNWEPFLAMMEREQEESGAEAGAESETTSL